MSFRLPSATAIAIAVVFLGCIRGAEPNAVAKPSGPAKRVYTATRLQLRPPVIDGRLTDTCWSANGDWAGNYTQFSPAHGGEPTKPSQLKVLYDDRYLYVGIRANDDPKKITRFAGPRDKFTGDIVGITFDSYFGHRIAFEFDLTAAGQKIDLVLNNDSWDTTWDPVWDGKVAQDESGWTAEFRIPLSQLRYTDAHPQIWGMHSWRWLARNSEESQWSLLANDNTGLVYSFGELHGLELPRPRPHVELVPYVLAKRTQLDAPGADGKSVRNEVSAGADAKVQLSTNYTLDATINPDFGQVEADPSEMNLTAFETFLEERRPFFIEGKNIFAFDFDDDDPLFYSRRIGHVPALAARSDAFEVPASTSILGAWKLTGKSRNGLSVGLLHAATAEEHARYFDHGGVMAQSLEPATQYAVLRVQQELDRGQTTFGGVVTVAKRSPKTAALSDLLPRQSIVGGLDYEKYWSDRTYSFTAKAIASHVTGSAPAINRLQTASARYFQRPDASYLTYDPTRTTLNGWGAYLMAGKRSKGHWRYHEKLTAYSPGLDFNDLGYLREADRVRQHTEIAYVEKQPAGVYREYELGLLNNNEWNFGREHLKSEVQARAKGTLSNKAYVEAFVTGIGEALDPVALRGGPSLRTPPTLATDVYGSTDGERAVVASLAAGRGIAANDAYRSWYVKPTLSYRPNSALTFSLSATRETTTDRRHFVSSTTAGAAPASIVSTLQSDSLTFTARVQWFIRPEVSIQYYGSPFGSTGTYSSYARVVDGRASNYDQRAALLPAPTYANGSYLFDTDFDGRPDYTVGRPDFSFGQFRSNLVLRWEFRPGSNLYVVWAQERSDFRPTPSTSGAIIRRLSSAPETNVFLIKCSYWFSL